VENTSFVYLVRQYLLFEPLRFCFQHCKEMHREFRRLFMALLASFYFGGKSNNISVFFSQFFSF